MLANRNLVSAEKNLMLKMCARVTPRKAERPRLKPEEPRFSMATTSSRFMPIKAGRSAA